KLQIWVLSTDTIIKTWTILDQDCIQELELNAWLHLGILVWFAPYLDASPEIEKCVTRFTLQFPKLNCLQHLCMNSLLFKTPLENIAQRPEDPLGDPLHHSLTDLTSSPLDLLC
ncbi:hypothetical protein A6R68_14538, partial [Neotoma lepida]